LSVAMVDVWCWVTMRVSLHSKDIPMDEALAVCNSFVASDRDDHEREREILGTWFEKRRRDRGKAQADDS
jgi:hypothetical protein